MNKVFIRAVGKLPQGWPREACDEYRERLAPFCQLDLAELAEGHDGSAKPDVTRTKQIEAASLLKSIPTDAIVIALDETGRVESSMDFAKRVSDWSDQGHALCFLIGGSWGLDASVRERADHVLSFGKMTFPHAMARIMLLEQMYRVAMIERGKTYHK